MSIQDNIKQVETYTTLTEEKLTEIIKDVMTVKDKDNIVLYQGCATYGAALRSSSNLNICSNPNCKTCREWDDAMKKELLNYIR